MKDEIYEQLTKIRRNNNDVSLLKYINFGDLSGATDNTLKVALKTIKAELEQRSRK